MKTTLLLTITTLTLMTNVHAKSLFGTIEKYVNVETGSVVEIASNRTDKFDMSQFAASTKEEISGVKAGERILLTTYVNKSKTQTINRYCDVYYVFENKMAQVGCSTYSVDQEANKDAPRRLDFMVTNVDEVVSEVSELNGFRTNEKAELKISTATIKAGRNVKIVAIFENGEVLVQKTGYGMFFGDNVVERGDSIARVSINDLSQI